MQTVVADQSGLAGAGGAEHAEQPGATLEALGRAAEGEDNLMPYILDAVKAQATLGEVCDILRDVFGEYEEPAIF